MKQAGRKSAEKLATVTALPPRKVPPPADLSDDEAAIWVEVIPTKPASWWDAGSLPLLAQYCRVAVEARRIGEQVRVEGSYLGGPKADLSAYARLRRMQGSVSRELAQLATKMRLAQQSRYEKTAAATANERAGGGRKRPWDA